jgi:hypothetical protein
MRRLRIVSIVLVALLALGWVTLSYVAPRAVAARLSRATGLDVAVGRVSLGWPRGLVLRDLVMRGRDGAPILRVGSLAVDAFGLGRSLRLDGAVVRSASLFDGPAVDGRARRLRIAPARDGLAIDGVVEVGEAVVGVVDGRFDPATRQATARRVVLEGVTLDAAPARWPVATDRLVVAGSRVGNLDVDRLIAHGVVADAPPARLRARVRFGVGAARVRWNAAGQTLDVRLARIPLAAFAAGAFPAGRLSGGLATGVVRLGHVPGRLESRLRIGPMRLERDGETWLGWAGAVLDVRRFDISTRRLLGGKASLTSPVMIVGRAGTGVWPITGWETWTSPEWRQRVAALWTRFAARFGATPPDDEPAGGTTMAMADGTLTVMDDTMDPPARLEVHDLNARVHYEPGTELVDGRLDGRVGDGGRIVATLEAEPVPRATLAVSALPIDALDGWSTAGRALLGIPLGGALRLAAASPVLDLDVDVPGDPTEKRFGLATKVVDAVVEAVRDRVTKPLLLAADVEREDGIESLVLPVIAVDATAPTLTGEAADTVDRVAVLLRDFDDLSARLDGRFAPDESAVVAETRAAAVARYLTALGFGDRVVVGPVAAGPPGVVIALGGRGS